MQMTGKYERYRTEEGEGRTRCVACGAEWPFFEDDECLDHWCRRDWSD